MGHAQTVSLFFSFSFCMYRAGWLGFGLVFAAAGDPYRVGSGICLKITIFLGERRQDTS